MKLCSNTCRRVLGSLLLICSAAYATDDAAPSMGSSEERWFHITTALVATRMRYVEASNKSAHSINEQHKEKFEGYFSFDKESRFTIHTSVSSGYYFTRSYAETGFGMPWYQERGWNIFVRQLYGQAEPVRGIQLQYGGLGINRGAISENISYDEDGYIEGERLSIRRPENLYFDELSVTYGYIGDYYSPNFFKRLDRFPQSNYHQFLVAKKFGKRVSLSGDVTHHAWSETARVGGTVDIHESRFIDSMRIGYYNRYNHDTGQGFEITAERHITPWMKVAGGWVSVDKGTMDLIPPSELALQRKPSLAAGIAPGGSLNADRFARGDSPYAAVNFRLNSMLAFNLFATTDHDQTSYVIKNSTIALMSLECDLKPALRKFGLQ